MKILHVSTYDAVGGAARAAFRLHAGLRQIHQDSTMFVASRLGDDPEVKAFAPRMDWPTRLRRLLRREWLARGTASYRASRLANCEMFSDDRTEYGVSPWEQLPECDVINFHWVAGFVDYRAFLMPALRAHPAVWTLHDMNAFTGGCHYSNDCDGYRDRCGRCPKLGSDDLGDFSHQIWSRKHRTLGQADRGQLHIVTPSRWLARQAKQSTLLGQFPISVIPYGLDTDVFVPRARDVARSALGVPQEANVLLFVSDSMENRRKGFSLLAKALTRLKGVPNLFLLSLGRGTPPLDFSVLHLHLNHIGDDRLLALVYSAADLFVIPSLQDNLPNTVLESLACSTPVVGFDVGGIPDMVRPGETGMLAPAGDVAALANAIKELLKDDELRASMSERCRRIAVEEYHLVVQARRYAELYDSLVRQ